MASSPGSLAKPVHRLLSPFPRAWELSVGVQGGASPPRPGKRQQEAQATLLLQPCPCQVSWWPQLARL